MVKESQSGMKIELKQIVINGGTGVRVCRAAPGELMAQDSFQMTVALTDINGGELTSCLKCV